MDDSDALMNDIIALFTDIKSLLTDIDGKLKDPGWTGEAHDKCCDINALIELYRGEIESIFSATRTGTRTFIHDTDYFRYTSEAVRKLGNW